MDELTIGDKKYVSSKRAAAITGYAKDYVGQLCREGHVKAKMVGRSWYVLESSIREHRFGKPEEKRDAQRTGSEKKGVEGGTATPSGTASVSILSETWESSTYRSEEAPRMPDLIPGGSIREVHETAQILDMSEGRQSLTEMQIAWKEWFENKPEPVLAPSEGSEEEEQGESDEEEEQLEATEHAEEPVSIPVHRIPAVAPPVARSVMLDIAAPQPVRAPIRSTHATAGLIPQSKVQTGPDGRASLATIALMISIAGIAIAIGVIGSGFADSYLESNAIIRYLGGTSSINK